MQRRIKAIKITTIAERGNAEKRVLCTLIIFQCAVLLPPTH